IVVMKDGKQYYVEDIPAYDGMHTGALTLRQPGQYLITAFNPHTGGEAEARVAVAPPPLSEEFQKNASAEQQRQAEEYLSLPASEAIPGLPLIIVAVFIILVALLVFGNPLKKK
ncbi:MAG: hypothetical protein QXH30_00325, partial [Candidatus Bilamarchaeaceae archaeon]